MNADAVRTAAARIAGAVRRTPVLRSGTLDRLAGRELHFKCELFQTTGSFKFRGATNAVRNLSPDAAARGVVTHSSGNHGQALARAAQLAGVAATVVVPTNAAAVKKAAILGYGAKIVECGPTLAEREAAVAGIVAATGATLIPPFDHADVIAGQGTGALELLDDVPDCSALVAPVGGGGMISGFCLAAETRTPAVPVFGAEPAGADDAARSKAAGERVELAATRSIADGLLANRLGALTWPIVRDRVARIFTVEDAATVAAMRLVWERMKLVIEPSAAVGVAAVLSDEFRAMPGLPRVGVVLCGGNVSLDRLYWSGS